MTCEAVQARLSEFADGDLTPVEAVALEDHLGTCPACEMLLGDLRRIKSAARDLPPVAPPGYIALEIAAKLQRSEPAAGRRPLAAAAGPWLGLAAALLLITAGAYFLAELASPPEPAQVVAVPASPTRVDAALGELGQAVDGAITDLQSLAKDTDRPVESAVAAQLLDSLSVIDSAIGDSRAVLDEDPANRPAHDSLIQALRRKVRVLQSTMALINELRAGDAEGAGQALEGLGKKS